MTYDDARRLQEQWKAKHGDTLCHHRQLINNLRSKIGENTNQWVCMECGESVGKPER